MLTGPVRQYEYVEIFSSCYNAIKRLIRRHDLQIVNAER